MKRQRLSLKNWLSSKFIALFHCVWNISFHRVSYKVLELLFTSNTLQEILCYFLRCNCVTD